MQIVSEIFAGAAKRYPDRTFVNDETRSLTYREFEIEVCRLANVLVANGARPGEPVGIYLPSSIDLVLAYHACQRLGAIAMPLSAMNKQREIDGIARRTDVALIITGSAGRDVAVAVAATVGTLQTILSVSGGSAGTIDVHTEMSAASTSFELVDRDPEDVATVFFTSGTTGDPKGIMQSHRSIYSTVRDMEVFNRFRSGKEVVLSVLPMFNNFGATSVMVETVFTGGTLVIHERWNTQRVLHAIGEHGVTFFAGTPTMLTFMTQEYDSKQHDLSSLKLAVTGGAPVSPELIVACKELMDVDVRQIYGSTEVCGNVVGEPVEGARKRSSAGTAVGSTSITIVDDEDNEVPIGTIGEIIVSGDTVALGYWGDEEATKVAFSDRGWRSGDLGYLDEESYLFIVDRKKDLIICGGFNIYPAEVEGVLFTHPEVKIAAVVGLTDEVRGEIPVAFVVPKSVGSDGLSAEIIEYCRRELAAYKVPRKIIFLDELPLGPSGKILKRELRDSPPISRQTTSSTAKR